MGDALWPALERLPPGAGVIVRHYSLDLPARRALFAAIARVGRRRRLVIVRAGQDRLGRGEQGVHGRQSTRTEGLRTWPAHHAREIVAARRAGADAIMISPILATRSHPGAAGIGRVRAARLARLAGPRAIALGGIRPETIRQWQSAGFYGIAAIDGWLTLRH